MMEHLDKQKKKVVLSITWILVLCVITAAISYFSSTMAFENEFYTGNYGIDVIEHFRSPDKWFPSETVDKSVYAENTGTYPLLIRISYEEYWKNEDGDYIAGYTSNGVEYENIFDINGDGSNLLEAAVKNFGDVDNSEDPAITILNDSSRISTGSEWVYYDGYYYRTSLLEAGATTGDWLNSVTLNESLSDLYTQTETKYIKAACTSSAGSLVPIIKSTDADGNNTYYDIENTEDAAEAEDKGWDGSSWTYIEVTNTNITGISLGFEGAKYNLNIKVSSLQAIWAAVKEEWGLSASDISDMPSSLQALFQGLEGYNTI